MMRARAYLVGCLALAAGACSPVDREVGPLPPGLAGTDWRAETITGLAALPGVASTLSFLDAARVGGTAGCNRYSAPFAVEDGQLRIGPLVGTRMACAPPAMEQERRFMTALEQGRRFERDGPALLLRSAGREEPTRFVRAGAPDGGPR